MSDFADLMKLVDEKGFLPLDMQAAVLSRFLKLHGGPLNVCACNNRTVQKLFDVVECGKTHSWHHS